MFTLLHCRCALVREAEAIELKMSTAPGKVKCALFCKSICDLRTLSFGTNNTFELDSLSCSNTTAEDGTLVSPTERQDPSAAGKATVDAELTALREMNNEPKTSLFCE